MFGSVPCLFQVGTPATWPKSAVVIRVVFAVTLSQDAAAVMGATSDWVEGSVGAVDAATMSNYMSVYRGASTSDRWLKSK